MSPITTQSRSSLEHPPRPHHNTLSPLSLWDGMLQDQEMLDFEVNKFITGHGLLYDTLKSQVLEEVVEDSG